MNRNFSIVITPAFSPQGLPLAPQIVVCVISNTLGDATPISRHLASDAEIDAAVDEMIRNLESLRRKAKATLRKTTQSQLIALMVKGAT